MSCKHSAPSPLVGANKGIYSQFNKIMKKEIIQDMVYSQLSYA
jgi:hypothetical protein